MFVRASLVVLTFIHSGLALSDDDEQRKAAIKEALKKGAHLIECTVQNCVDDNTGEIVGRGPPGAYLVYPNDDNHDDDIKSTQRALQTSM